jgi:hypothetical protein
LLRRIHLLYPRSKTADKKHVRGLARMQPAAPWRLLYSSRTAQSGLASDLRHSDFVAYQSDGFVLLDVRSLSLQRLQFFHMILLNLAAETQSKEG